jgi:hypothetical protein
MKKVGNSVFLCYENYKLLNMTHIIKGLLLGAFTLLFSCCKQTVYTTDKMPDKQLRWGNGGGFVGKETGYTLLDNGQVFYQAAGAALVEMKKSRAKKAKNIFKTVDNLGLATLDFKHPGNTYSYIEVVNGENAQRIIWGDKQHAVDPKIQELFRQLGGLVKIDK